MNRLHIVSFVNKFEIVLAMYSAALFYSCEKDNNTEDSSSSQDEQYYFKFDGSNKMDISRDAGSVKINFDCNQEWNISYNGNISGINITPTQGKGKGYVTVSYAEAQSKEDNGNIQWNEKGVVVFHFLEGTKSKYIQTTKTFYLNRTGSQKIEQYYFRFVDISGLKIGPDAGSTKICFECNQDWSVSYSGNITGCTVSPTKGTGGGSVTISYSDAQRKEYYGSYEWDERGELHFSVLEGPKNNYREVTKTFSFYRRGKMQKP